MVRLAPMALRTRSRAGSATDTNDVMMPCHRRKSERPGDEKPEASAGDGDGVEQL